MGAAGRDPGPTALIPRAGSPAPLAPTRRQELGLAAAQPARTLPLPAPRVPGGSAAAGAGGGAELVAAAQEGKFGGGGAAGAGPGSPEGASG